MLFFVEHPFGRTDIKTATLTHEQFIQFLLFHSEKAYFHEDLCPVVHKGQF